MITLKSWTTLEAKADFKLKPPKSNDTRVKTRAITVSKGQLFQITNSEMNQATSGIVMIDRKGKGHLGIGYPFTAEQILALFNVGS